MPQRLDDPVPMLSTLSIALGIALILFTLVDVFFTVFMLGGGAGVQSRFIADRTWRLALRAHDSHSRRSHSLLRGVGPFIVLLVIAAWALELVIGWALVFTPAAFEESASEIANLNFHDRLIFAASTVIGRAGNSPELTVTSDNWETVHALAGFTGVVIITFALAYVLPILASVAQSRSIAALINALGDSVEDMRSLGETPHGSSFELHLVGLAPAIMLVAEQHRAYPVLHYFHARERHAALAPAVAKLVLLLRSDTDGMDKVDRTVVKPLERAVFNLLEALSTMGLDRYAHDRDGIDDDALDSIVVDPTSRRHSDERHSTEWLKAYVRFDGWVWEEVTGEDAPEGFREGEFGNTGSDGADEPRRR